MGVTREELQQAGANPELARILADRWPRRDPGDLTRNPMAVALLVAFLGALGWQMVSVTDLKSGQARLEEKIIGLDQRMVRIEEKVNGLDQRMIQIDQRMMQIDGKLDQLLQKQ